MSDKRTVDGCTGPFSDARDCPVHRPSHLTPEGERVALLNTIDYLKRRCEEGEAAAYARGRADERSELLAKVRALAIRESVGHEGNYYSCRLCRSGWEIHEEHIPTCPLAHAATPTEGA